MSELNRLRLGSIAFAVLWTAFMLWWIGASDSVSAAMTGASGMIVGLTWYGAMRRWALRRGVAAK